MLERLDIENFRAFKKLTMPELARINLISGKNNAGKTALLESIQLHVSEFSHEALHNILEEREEFFTKSVSRENLTPLKHFFYGHKINPDNSRLTISSNLDTHTLDIGRSFLVKDGESYSRQFEQLPFEEAMLMADEDDETVSVLLFSSHSSPKELAPLFDNGQLDMNLRRRMRMSKDFIPVNFVPSNGINMQSLANLWDRISLTSLEDHVLAGLQIIEPRITGITFVQSGRAGSNRIPVVKLSHVDEPVTLRSLGDGMSRIFHIILSLVNSEDGILLIDEFENGLHWSVQKSIWKVIFELSKKHNIQIFATSHSNDCIASFSAIWEEDVSNAIFYRVEAKSEGYVEAVSYKFKDLDDALDFDVEVR